MLDERVDCAENLKTAKAYDLDMVTKPFSEPLNPVVKEIVILEETMHIRIDLFHRRIKMISQNNILQLCLP